MTIRTPLLIVTVACLLFACTERVPEQPAEPRHPVDRKTQQTSLSQAGPTAGLDGTEIQGLPNREPVVSMMPDRTAGQPTLTFERDQPTTLLPYPGIRRNQESYDALGENRFINSRNDPLSTFAADVDTASYANVRRLITAGQLPPPGSIRIEEMVNYFAYDSPEPRGQEVFSLHLEGGPSPFHPDYRLVKIGIKGREAVAEKLPPSNLVFLIDVSGSMDHPRKLPLLKRALTMLSRQLSGHDRLAIVTYAGSEQIVLQPTPGDRRTDIEQAIESLRPGGSTHGSRGLQTAYELAHRAFMPGGNNRIILASDGDFNVGQTSRDQLRQLIETERQGGIFLTVLGFGSGNYHDDTMELLADRGNGNYAYIDSLLEAKKVLVKEISGTLFALAEDVKIQVEFNPALVGAYRLIGYENRALADEDFQDDGADAGEIGLGHTVTALYELIPAGHPDIPGIEELKYRLPAPSEKTDHHELLTVKLRYRPVGGGTGRQLSASLADFDPAAAETSTDFRFASAVAGYGMLLKNSAYLGQFNWEACLELVRKNRGEDRKGYRAQFYQLVEMSQLLHQNS